MQEESSNTDRIVSTVLTIIWFIVGILAFYLAFRNSNIIAVIIGAGAIWYAFVWLKVFRLKRKITAKEALMPWRVKKDFDN